MSNSIEDVVVSEIESAIGTASKKPKKEKKPA